MKPGDVIVRSDESGWHAVKILLMDSWPDGTKTAHCLTYDVAAEKPAIEALAEAGVRIWHAPIDAGSFDQGWELIGNRTPTKDEFIGFVEYLKHTDFSRYADFTQQDPNVIARQANEHYGRAYALGDQGQRIEAIAEYSRAIELFPLFFEAIDNRAFTYMELGQFREALNDFEDSLRVNPNGVAAYFSRGECLMKLGDLAAAEAVFLQGQTRFPEQRAIFEKFLNHVHVLRRKT
jgi:tetratricopeptide (TPR) repeat protein